jgi:release factor glutamine methyltransferase
LNLADRLGSAGCVAAEEEADLLTAAAPDPSTLEGWVIRREAGEPLAWITGTTTFCGCTVRIDHGVYVPRYETEELARRAAAALRDVGGQEIGGRETGGRAVDLCTGSGAVAVVLAEQGRVVGVDIDPKAAACARRNGIPAAVCDMGDALRPGSFDVVTAVAPYVPTEEMAYLPADVQRYEPRTALDGGADGLYVVRRAVERAARLLRTGGWLFLEVGGDQDRSLTGLLEHYAFGAATTWADSDGDLRGISVQLDSRRRITARGTAPQGT